MRGIDRDSHEPAYRQLAGILKEMIVSGVLPAGADLPPEKELAAEYGMSLVMVRQATQILKNEGLIISSRGKPSRVRPIRLIGERRYSMGKANYEPDVASTFAREHGIPWSDFDLTRQYAIVPAPARVALALRIPEGTDVYQRQFTHATGGVMLRLSYSYLEVERFKDTILTDPDEPLWPGGTVAQLKHMGLDVSLVHSEVSSRFATPEEAKILQLQARTPITELWRTEMIGRHESVMEPVEVAQHIYPPDGQILVFDIPVGPNPWKPGPVTDAPD